MAEIQSLISELQRHHGEQMQLMRNQLDAMLNQQRNAQPNQANQANVGESARDVKEKNLADSMEPFTYDPEDNAIFESWYKRYETTFTTDVATWTEAEKVRLLMRKFNRADYDKFADSLLPQVPTDLTLAQAVTLLKPMFGYTETLFKMRFKCFDTRIEESESYRAYGARVNKMGEKFDLASLTADDFKTLLFISGLKDARHSLVLEKLLNKVNEQQRKLEAITDDATRAAFVKLKVNDLINEAQNIISLKKDKSVVSEALPPTPAFGEVNAINSRKSGKQPPTRQSPSSAAGSFGNKASRPCKFCGDGHWDRDCVFKARQCDSCKAVGHKSGFCTTAAEALRAEIEKLRKYQRRSEAAVSVVSENARSDRKFLTPRINNRFVKLQVDSASDLTIISANNWQQLGKPSLMPSLVSPGSASGHPVNLWGKFSCVMQANGITASGECYVSARLNLLGSDWMTKLGLWDVPLSAVCHQVKQLSKNAEPNSELLAKQAMEQFPELFKEGLGRFNKSSASMTLKQDAKAVFIRARPPPFAAMKPIEEEILRGVHEGVYQATEYSDFAAPIVVVKKKSGKIRICGDYSTGLNDALEPNKFPLPTADQIFTALTGCEIFSVIDLSDAFLQVPLDVTASKLLTINTHLGLFNVTRLQPGVKTAPGIFQEITSKMLCGIKAFAFIDDIVLGAKNADEHKKLLFEVLDRIQNNGFRLRVDKCQFGKRTIPFCGHILDKEGIRPNPAKTQQISDIPRPTDVHQLRSFLGAVNYYGRFVKNMMNLRGPLIELTVDNTDFLWGDSQEKSFINLKEIMSSDLVLTHYDPLKKIVVAADASAYGMGGCIMHELPDRSLHPIIHVSKSFNAAQKNYSQIEKEAEALVFTVKRCHKYLFGRRFELHTDHKPLLTIFGSKKGIPVVTASRLQRHALTLLAYDFEVKYIDTASFGYADMLSRLISKHERNLEDTVIASIQADIEPQCFAIETARALPVRFVNIQKGTGDCQILRQVCRYIQTAWPRSRKEIGNHEVENFFDQRDALSIIDGCIFFGDRIVIPQDFRSQILKELHRGHPGMVRMKLLARSKVFWPHIDKDIEKIVKACESCAITGKTPIKCTLQPWTIPTKPWSRVHIDYAGPIDGMSFLVIVDALSKWPEIFLTKSTTTARTTELLSEAFARHGHCDIIVSDNGPQFASSEFETFCKTLGISHVRTAPYHPQSNGQAEKFVDLLKTGLKRSEGSLEKRLREFLQTYRSTPTYNLGAKSPSEILNGRSMKSRLDLLKPTVLKTSMAQQFDAHHGAKWKEFAENNPVFYQLHQSNATWNWVPGIIQRRLGTVNYEVKLDSGRVVKAHSNQLKLRYENLDDALLDESEDDHQPTIEARDAHNESDTSEVFEDAEEETASKASDSFEPPPQVPEVRRQSARTNFGIPATRYGYDEYHT